MLKAIRNNVANGVTCLNLLCGALAVVAAFGCREQAVCGLMGYQLAFVLIALGAVADFADGLVARALGASSDIGKQLDSLSDLVTFGLAPAMVVYNLMQCAYAGSAANLLAMLIPVAGALRLARFNVSTDQATTFTGLPIPANAIFWIGAAEWLATHPATPQWVVLAAVVALSALMVCNLRMFSFKMHGLGLRESWAQFLLLACSVALVALLGVPGLAAAIVLYVVLAVVKRER